jgi:acyl-CoA synthetase (AMP-forming)/AMP-acid ligase II
MLSSITVALGSLYICGVKRKDRPYVCLPLYHVSGGLMGMGFSIIFGSTVVLAKKFSVANYWTDCIKYQCTVDVKLCCRIFPTSCPTASLALFLSTTTTTRLGNFFQIERQDLRFLTSGKLLGVY